MPKPAQNNAPAKPKRVSANVVRDRAQNLTEEFLRCRDDGHIWNLYRLLRVRGGFERSYWCKSCKTAKHQFVSKNGSVITRSYNYDKGYQMPGVGRLYGNHRAVLRMEHLERIVARAEASGQLYETDEGTLIGEFSATP
jgi:hypothetical protein